jgi:hypothetical protein
MYHRKRFNRDNSQVYTRAITRYSSSQQLKPAGFSCTKEINIKEIMKHYNIKSCTVSFIINEKHWTHITKNYDMVKIRELLNNYKGCNNYQSKFTDDDVRNIRQRLQNGETNKSISKSCNVSPTVISQIKSNKTYQNII